MNSTYPQTMVLLPAQSRLRLAGDKMRPDILIGKLAKDVPTKELVPTGHNKGWQRDCTALVDLL
jgi:hypothetical protein